MIFIWNQKLGRPECPYMKRWAIGFASLFTIRVHRWYSGDDDRAFHDHPWNFLCFVIAGSYVDVSKEGREVMSTGTIKYRKATHSHTVETKGCWTLILTGPEKRSWGFSTKTKAGNPTWIEANRYFRKRGHHPCANSIREPEPAEKISVDITQKDIDACLTGPDSWKHSSAVDTVLRNMFPNDRVSVGLYDAKIGKWSYGLPLTVRAFNEKYDHLHYGQNIGPLKPFSFELNDPSLAKSPYSTSEPNRSDLDD